MKDPIEIDVTLPPSTKLYMVLHAIATIAATRGESPFDLGSLLEETGHGDLSACPACSVRNFQHRGGCIYAK